MYKRQAAVNTKFEEKGLDVRIDHRSYVRQGLDLIPVSYTHLERIFQNSVSLLT